MEASEKRWTKDAWIYELRTNQHFTLKTNALKEADLTDFLKCFGKDETGGTPALPGRKDSDCFKKFSYDEIVARDKANLDILRLSCVCGAVRRRGRSGREGGTRRAVKLSLNIELLTLNVEVTN